LETVTTRWPDFYIAGASRAGTTSLYSTLKNHSQIFLPREKELKYFVKIASAKNKEKATLEYLSHFVNARADQKIGEASPNYLYEVFVDKRIKSKQPEAKIIVSLRDPVERLISHALMIIRNQGLTISLEQKILQLFDDNEAEILLEGCYCKNLKRFSNTFGNQNIFIMIFEEWIDNPRKEINKLLRFLGVEQAMESLDLASINGYKEHRNSFTKALVTNKTVRAIAYKMIPTETRLKLKYFFLKSNAKPSIPEHLRLKLKDFYHDDVQNVESFLNKKLPWKNFKL